jgi:hypothetical protein
MTKTPEQLAEEYVAHNRSYPYDSLNAQDRYMRNSFLAGYQAAKDEYKEAIDTYNDVAKQMMEEAIRIMSPKDQAADADKVMNSPEKQDSCEHILDMEKMVDVNLSSEWISVKERLPEYDVEVLTFETGNYKVNAVSEYTQWWWDSNEGFERNPTHWMPLPKPPEEK